MSHSIVDIRHMGDALRNTGYKNIESAVSEIVDNSVEADADDIFIILSEELNADSGRKQVTEIAFLDNGTGMDVDVLGRCLGFGATTRDCRRGMGRFGVGLPQSSLYACPEVEVYSWQNGLDSVQKVFLDINKIKEGEQTEIEDPCCVNFPKKYEAYTQYRTFDNDYDFTKSGTLVVWKNCDRVQPKTSSPLTSRLEFALGQKFRYFISRGTVNIRIIPDANQESAIDVYPNDPMFRMDNNLVLGDAAHPTDLNKHKTGSKYVPIFEPYNGKDNQIQDGTVVVPVKYRDHNTGEVKDSSVTVKFSIVKQEFYDETACKSNPGQQPFGKYAKKLEGISVVRAGREIDFGQFDYYENINEPEHRWWGCEISFDPELDELFGVSNNKQYVELKRVEKEDFDLDEEIQPMWLQLKELVSNTIKEMYKRNKVIRKMTRTPDDLETAAVDIINTVEEDSSDVDSDTNQARETKDETELIERGKAELKDQGIANPTDEDALKFLNNKVNIKYAQLGQFGPMFDYNLELSCVVLTFNTDHKFYAEILSKIYDNQDVKTAFELLIAAFVQSINTTNRFQKEENDNLVTEWQEKLRKYINELLNPRK